MAVSLVKDINTGAGNSYPENLTAIGNTLYFSASNGTNGSELWKSDGTASGTVLVKDINTGASHSSPAELTAIGNTLYFRASDGTNGHELYKLLANINEKLSLGHFEVWMEDGWPIFRHSLFTSNNHLAFRNQIEQVSIIALEECERFYPAFQFLMWDKKSASDSLDHLMLNALGEA